ncbi:MAG: NUDIX domain-containing protein [Angustibacter sp.]
MGTAERRPAPRLTEFTVDGDRPDDDRSLPRDGGHPTPPDGDRRMPHDGDRPTVGDGDGWVVCSCGTKHWGRHGAAGLLLIRSDEEIGGLAVFLQLRADWTHQGGTWGVPGGARDSHETTCQTAIREAHEEEGVDPATVQVVDEVVEDHGPWSYTYVIAVPRASSHGPDQEVGVSNSESAAAEWVPLSVVPGRTLHPGLASAWPMLARRLGSMTALLNERAAQSDD